jgi:hypothetical protein
MKAEARTSTHGMPYDTNSTLRSDIFFAHLIGRGLTKEHTASSLAFVGTSQRDDEQGKRRNEDDPALFVSGS